MDAYGVEAGERKKPWNFLLKWGTAILLFIVFWWCLAMIIIGATVEKPPKTSLAIAILVCGCLTMFITILGFVGVAFPGRLIFAVYSGLEACMILYQFVLMGIMYAKNGKYAKFADPVRRAKYIKYINKARGAFVVFLIFQCILLAFTALSAILIKPGSAYETYDPEADQRNRDQLDAMANERGGQFGGSTFAANYGKIRGKMQKKYGGIMKKAGMGRF